MTPEKQRIAIATTCGWKDLETKWLHYHQWERPDGLVSYGSINDKYFCLPDYLNDLNAMNEAEKVLYLSGKYSSFEPHLRRIVADDFATGKHWSLHIVHATAAQRAETFLRTIGKWEEND